MLVLTPGIVTVSYDISNARHAAEEVVKLGKRAAEAGTFGVGALLMERSGRVLAHAINAVVDHGELQDPTAHAERQLIDWFFQAQAEGLAITPRDLVIVSSLDPCAMCAGAILYGGFNAVALAEDSLSGIHSAGRPHRLPSELWPKADSVFGLLQVRGRPGNANHILSRLSGNVTRFLLSESELCFQHSLEHTRSIIYGAELDLMGATLEECKISTDNWKNLKALAGKLPRNVVLPEKPISLQNFSSHRGAALFSNDGCALVDETSTVLLAAEGCEYLAPTRSSVLELIRAYVWLRKAAWKQLRLRFPHQRKCSLIKLRPPNVSAKAVMEIGALGSFLENQHLAHRLPAFGFMQSDSDREAEYVLASLPPYYTSVMKLTVGQVGALAD
jgi:tRNA(Arg) A34 adenosine deaminase TadA